MIIVSVRHLIDQTLGLYGISHYCDLFFYYDSGLFNGSMVPLLLTFMLLRDEIKMPH